MAQINPEQNVQIIQPTNENSAVEQTTANQLDTISEQPRKEIEYADFETRLLALIIDIGILTILFIIIALISDYLIKDYLIYIYRFALPLVLLIYNIYLTNRYKATFGKMILGIKVVSNNSAKLKLRIIIFRETLGKFISLITIFGYLLIFITKRNQTLHDMIADTVVIYKHDKAVPNGLFLIILIVLFVFITAFYFPEISIVICSTYLISILIRRKSVMAAKIYSENLAPFKDMLMSEVIQSEALMKFLDEKGIIRKKDIVGKIKGWHAESNYTVQEYIDIKQAARTAKVLVVVKWIVCAIVLLSISRCW